MCDYCGCRRQGPTAELHREHRLLESLGDQVRAALDDGANPEPAFSQLVSLLETHAAKEEIGLFVHVPPPLDEQVTGLCSEHDDLRAWFGHGAHGIRVGDALRLLVTHIEDEEYDLFPHVIDALDPEDWEEIELAHRAIELVWRAPCAEEACTAG